MNKQGYISISFDDGYKSDLTVALPEQINRGMIPKGTSYLIGNHVHESSETKLSISEIQELASYGWDLEDHSFHHYLIDSTHPHGMGDLTATELNDELDLMDELFSETLKISKPEHWCVPGTTLTKMMMDIIGARRKTINVGGSKIITPYTNRLTLPSYPFTAIMDTLPKLIDDIAKYGLAVDLYADGLNDSTSVDRYKFMLDYALNSGIQFVTVRELYDIYQLKGYNAIGAGF